MADVLEVGHAGDADSVTILTLNRPDSLNSLSVELKQALLAALSAAAADPGVRAVVLTGSGRAFCAGQDLAEHVALLESGDATPLATVREHYNPIAHSLLTMPKPVIAAVNGTAAGAGASLAMACDLRVVSSQATFLLAFANVGLGLDTGISWTLPRLVGSARAMELALLVEPFSAERAAELGLVTQLVEPDRVLPAAIDLASGLGRGPTAAYAAIKQAIHFGGSHPLAESLENEAVQQNLAGATGDHRSAVQAFLRKQRPVFTGH
ncbi:MAG: echA11 [Frankiales bacterium]|nr:echA11 [Frankiales bacterium]